MIIKSIKKLNRKKKGKLIFNTDNDKYKKYFGFNLFFDLINAKEKERLKILMEYGKKTPLMIKYKIENFFDDLVEGFDEFIESVYELNQLRKNYK